MRHLYSTIGMFFLCLSAAAARAGNLVYRQLGIADGLFNNQARMISALPDGRVLVATDGMFNLYNGARFEPVECDQTRCLPIRSFTDLCQYEVQGDKVWIRDFYYLYLMDTRCAAFVYDVARRFANSELHGPFQRIFFDQDGMAWIVTPDNCLYRYDWQHKALRVWQPAPRGPKDQRVVSVCQCGPFHCIFFSNGEMRLWEQRHRVWILSDNSQAVTGSSVTTRVMAWDERSIVAAFGGPANRLMVYDIFTHRWRLLIRQEGMFTSLRRFGDKLYATNDNGLLVFDRNLNLISSQTQFLLDDGTLLRDHIMDVLVDRQGGVWLCTFTSGVLYTHQYRKVAVTYTNGSEFADQRHVRCLIPYDATHLLAGTADGLFLFDVLSHDFRPFSPLTQGALFFNLSKDSHGNVWASSSKGLFRLQGRSATLYNMSDVEGLTSDPVRECQEVAPGQYIICNGLNLVGLFSVQSRRFVPFNRRTHQLDDYRTISNIRVFPERRTALVNSQNGCFFYNYGTGRLTPLPLKAGYSNKFNCQYADDRGQLWLGTQNGLLLCSADGRVLRRLTAQDGLPNSCIQAVVENRWGQYWVSTSNGVALLCQTTSQGGRGELSVASYGVPDGVQAGELAERAVAIMPDGQVFFGGMQGITCMNAKWLMSRRQHLKPIYIGAEVMGQNVAADGLFRGHRVLYADSIRNRVTLRLRHNENFVTLHFSALNYISPQHTNYRYRLRGVDKQWNVCRTADGMGTASYTSLEPGTYLFEAQARQQGECWGDSLLLTLVVRPPFWATWWAYLLYACFGAALLYFLLRFYLDGQRATLRMEQERERHVEQQRLDEMKFRFFTNISHELRTPLTLIITPLDMLISKMKDRSERNDLERIRHSAYVLLQLVNQLLDFRRLEKQGERLNAQPTAIRPLADECYRDFQHLAGSRNMRYEFRCTMPPDATFCLDADKMRKVLNNLLSNAFKFTPDGGNVTLSVEPTGEGLLFAVSDTGIGIPPSDLPHVFDRFFQSGNTSGGATQLNTGSGIGLHLVKGYADLHKGRVEVESTVGKGTTFRVIIPCGLECAATAEGDVPHDIPNVNKASDAVEQAAEASPLSEATDMLPGETEATRPSSETRRNILLIVEDSRDFREFLTEVLSVHYTVLAAADGVEGLALAHDASPDLILSDVMMPRMDGYELCRTLKHDLRCSHIPVILLTAKNSDEGQAGAYEAGADSYIAKPFSMDVLLARVRQLLEQMERRRKLFRRTVTIDPKEIAVTSLDEKLIQRALNSMETHMADADFSVEQLSQEIGIDRTYLYRKMQSIVGQTPSEFMRSVRLKRAAQLLSQGGFGVAQVASMVGFNTVRYFSQHFKEMFGVNPAQYGGDATDSKAESSNTAE
jgi:signal transduction histidine kinase/DNA-binding response OmpR family regulator